MNRIKKKIILIFPVIFIVLILLVLVILFFDFGRLNIEKNQNEKFQVNINPGMSTSEIAALLKKEGVISSITAFKIQIYLKDSSSKLQAGRYLMKKNMSNQEAIKTLIKGPEEKFYSLPVPEGFLLKQIADRVGSRTPLDKDLFYKIANSEASKFKSKYKFLFNLPGNSLEGYLFPRTYLVKGTTSEEDLIQDMLEQYEIQTKNLPWENIEKLKISYHDVIIIASLIEKEAKVEEERPKVSAVIYNRLKKKMFLQICATVQYSLPAWKDKLTNEDLKINSPYNTYINKGLPPGPISNPGLPSLNAALNPEKSDYLYYVLTKDDKHFFTSSYKEFLEAKQKYNNK